MEDETRLAVEQALKLGADYAEARVQRDVGHTLTLNNGIAEPVTATRRMGIGIRVIMDGSMGFASTNNLEPAQIRSLAQTAVKIARAATRLISTPSKLAPERSWEDEWEVRMKIDIRRISIEEKFNVLFSIERALASEQVNVSLPSRILILDEDLTEKVYFNSEGSRIRGVVPRISLFFVLTGEEKGKGTIQRMHHEAQTRGWEAVKEWDAPEIAAAEAKMLGKMLREGVQAPRGEIDLVLGPEVTGIICHESCGHPQEADRILGREGAQAGESYVTREMIGKRIGSEQVTIIDDPTLPNSYGFYMYDDEGVKAGPRTLIKDGIISNLLHNRETASEFGVSSNAAARSAAYDREPIIRMANTFMQPGDYRLDELVEGIKRGVYMKSFMEWNIDDRRYNQRYVGLEAYSIEDGKIGPPVRNPILEVTTPGLYSRVDAVGREVEYSGATCGKGDPQQGAPVWTGGPPIRIRNIRLGG
jgi:TldD protein